MVKNAKKGFPAFQLDIYMPTIKIMIPKISESNVDELL